MRMPRLIKPLKVHVLVDGITTRHNAADFGHALELSAQYPVEAAVLIRTRLTGRVLARRNSSRGAA